MNSVIILLGPTGVGKTGASILLAESLKTEIISADSMQIYRGMDIGTAKPDTEQRQRVRHHMIDIIDPSQSFSTGQYVESLIPIIDSLHRKGKIPVITGGTGLYIRAITRGLFAGPTADWQLREELLAMERSSAGSLHAYLLKLDNAAAEKITPADIRRIVRALEVCLASGETMSGMQALHTKPLPYSFVKIGLTRDRSELYRLIDERVDGMIRDGLAEEVRRILALHPDKTPMQAIGYKEMAYFLGGNITLDEAIRIIKRNTRRYAKRQFTWFRKEEGISWIDVTGIYDSGEIFRKIQKTLAHWDVSQ